MSAFICPVCGDIKEEAAYCNYCNTSYIPLEEFLRQNNQKINQKINNILQLIEQIKAVDKHAVK